MLLGGGQIPIYEPGLKELIQKNKENITFSTDFKKAYRDSSIIFIAVGTPQQDNGDANMDFVKAVAKDIGSSIQDYKIIVNKSTMPVGSTKLVENIIKENLRDKNIKFDVISNPEFLKEGSAIKDFMSPDRIIIGGVKKSAIDSIKSVYAPLFARNNRIITMSAESAEMTKYVSNAILATKISFINEMSQIAEKVGANINDVRIGVGADSRVGYSFIYPSCGYGGSCFPKDIKALRFIAKKYNIETKILDAIELVNENQKNILVDKILNRFKDLKNMTFCIWGLSFKPETDDIRESPSINIISKLLSYGAFVQCYDPEAMDNMKNIFPNIKYFNNKYDALNNANALIIITEWNEFKNPDFKKIQKQTNIIFDGRNIFHNINMNDFEYYYIGGDNLK
ncbi:UDP-glucose/GDP-mannose dehydrogenase family protein [Helicobacter sp. MIT 99-5507]|uniref:UDP-glucose dehydrogenase family protein n=1 Tax=Helicobacter sp. MIT 99-5507 TaxID=152489 RepID=UPI00267FEE5F|nr:UDP-glucose/GDP-mannose dehydrogenase family protein [Helicobacter sp. MIT 99-5507]